MQGLKKEEVLGSKLSRVDTRMDSNVAEQLKGSECDSRKTPSSEPARLTGEFAKARQRYGMTCSL